MRVCITHLRIARVGGIERFLAGAVAFLSGRGHEVTVLYREHDGLPLPGARLQRLGGIALGSAGRVRAFARAVERHLERARHDVVLGLGKTARQDVLRLGGGLHRSFLRHVPPRARLRRLDRASLELEAAALAAPGLRRIVVNSRMVERELQREYAPAAPVDVIHNGVDLERFSPAAQAAAGRALRAALGLGPDDVAFLFLGNGFRRKGLDLAIEALARLREPRAHLVVAGDDGEREAFAAQAVAAGVGARAHFIGERQDAAACYVAGDAYLLPTRYDPFANTTLEALACGRPVITTDGNGGAEVLDAEAGTVAALAHGADGLAEAMRRWCDPDTRRRGGEAALRVARRHPLAGTMEQLERALRAAAGAAP